MKRFERISSEVKKELRKTFTETRQELDPLMNHLSFGKITPLWWIKPKRDRQNCAGQCYKGTWRIDTKSPTGRKMRNWYTNLIILSKEYYDSNGIEDIKGVFKHELLHLIAKDCHGPHFKMLARSCNAHLNCPARKKSTS